MGCRRHAAIAHFAEGRPDWLCRDELGVAFNGVALAPLSNASRVFPSTQPTFFRPPEAFFKAWAVPAALAKAGDNVVVVTLLKAPGGIRGVDYLDLAMPGAATE